MMLMSVMKTVVAIIMVLQIVQQIGLEFAKGYDNLKSMTVKSALNDLAG